MNNSKENIKKSFLFTHLKYIRPIWYNNLIPVGNSPWIDINTISPEDRGFLAASGQYVSKEGQLADLTYQAWFKGLIPGIDGEEAFPESTTNIQDNYIFIRRYFHPVWSVYVLLIRLLTFHNPFVEIKGFIKSRKIKRVSLFEKVKQREIKVDIAEQPLVSVIIPTLNRYEYLKDVLADLEKQTYRNFEVIVVDQSEPFRKEFYERFSLDLKLIYQEEKALWKARNEAVCLSKGNHVLLFDDDSRVEPDWISQHLQCIEYFKADISSGVSLSVEGGKVPETYSYFKLSDQIDTGNVMIRKDVFNKTGLFDRQFEKQRMGDAEFGLRAYLLGFRNISNPLAKRIHLKVGTGGLRQMGSWDAFRPKRFWSPRPVPSVLYYFRKYYGNRAAVYASLIAVPPSILPYRFKRNSKIMIFGTFLGILLSPLLLIEFVWSWKLATQKMKD